MTTNADVELELASTLRTLLRNLGLLPDGYECEVRLHRGNRKKRRDAAFGQNWDSDTDSVRIAFTPMEEGAEPALEVATMPPEMAKPGPESEVADDRMSDLFRALNRAEMRPGYEFVSLKWFRDAALSYEAFQWAADDSARHDVLREAIDNRWIVTSKIPNPRPPHFPVTAIRLNRQAPAVKAVVGDHESNSSVFKPVPLRGEALSTTVLNNRR